MYAAVLRTEVEQYTPKLDSWQEARVLITNVETRELLSQQAGRVILPTLRECKPTAEDVALLMYGQHGLSLPAARYQPIATEIDERTGHLVQYFSARIGSYFASKMKDASWIDVDVAKTRQLPIKAEDAESLDSLPFMELRLQ